MFLPLGFGQVRQQQRQFHVPLRRQHRHQIVKLEDEADVPRAPRGQFAVGQLVHALAGDAHRAFGGPVQPADQVQQRALARARRPHQRQKFARRHLQMQVRQHVNVFRAAMEDLLHAIDVHQRAIGLIHGSSFIASSPSRPRHPSSRPAQSTITFSPAATPALNIGVVVLRAADRHRAALGPAILHDEHHVAPVLLLHGGSWERSPCGPPPARTAGLAERHLHRHLRQDARVEFVEANAHLDGGLLRGRRSG